MERVVISCVLLMGIVGVTSLVSDCAGREAALEAFKECVKYRPSAECEIKM